MKVVQLKYKGIGHRRLFYATKNESASYITTHVYTAAEGRKDIDLDNLELGIWYLDFVFKTIGKYAFVVFEDGLKTLILIITIAN